MNGFQYQMVGTLISEGFVFDIPHHETLCCMELSFVKKVTEVSIDGEKAEFTFEEGLLHFEDTKVQKSVGV